MSDLIEVAPFQAYDESDLAALNEMMRELDPAFSGANEDYVSRMITSPHHELVGARARETGELVGTLALTEVIEPAIRYGYMGGVAVSTKARRMGIGMALLTEGVDPWAAKQELPFVEFVTETHRAAAIRLYERWGAVRVTDGREVRNGILFNKSYKDAA